MTPTEALDQLIDTGVLSREAFEACFSVGYLERAPFASCGWAPTTKGKLALAARKGERRMAKGWKNT